MTLHDSKAVVWAPCSPPVPYSLLTKLLMKKFSPLCMSEKDNIVARAWIGVYGTQQLIPAPCSDFLAILCYWKKQLSFGVLPTSSGLCGPLRSLSVAFCWLHSPKQHVLWQASWSCCPWFAHCPAGGVICRTAKKCPLRIVQCWSEGSYARSSGRDFIHSGLWFC